MPPKTQSILWTPRGLLSHLLPQFFRKIRSPAETLGASRSRPVPLDADQYHNFIKTKQNKFIKGLIERHRKHISLPERQPNDAALCVATGTWQKTSQMRPTHIFSSALGDNICTHLFGHPSIWQHSNGLLLPIPMKQAFDDWAFVITPKSLDATEAGAVRAIIRYQSFTRYFVRILDHKHEALSQPLYPSASKKQVGAPPIRLEGAPPPPPHTLKDLDGKTLQFRTAPHPGHAYLYFHTCCAVWKQVYLTSPDPKNLDEFWASFYQHITTLWPEAYVEASSITKIFNPKNIETKAPIVNKYHPPEAEPYEPRTS